MRASGRSIVCCAALAALAALPAQDLQQVQWGFDGRAVPGRFNVVSVYVHNPTARPFEGTVRLFRSQGFGGRLDAPIEEPCHLSPGSGRWVQLYPFVASTTDEWELVCGRASQQLEAVRPGPPATVLLEAERDGAPPPGLPSFPAARFPAFSAGTEGLGCVVLDHVPAWDGARRTAFLDWLRGGGRLHLLRSFGGDLRFPAELAMLNDPSARFHVGAGLVERHAFTRTQFGAAQRREIGLQASASDDELPEPLQAQLVERLRQVVAPRHSWGLIFLVGSVYLVLVGPMLWYWSRRWSVRRTNLTLLGIVGSCSWLLMSIGARGHDEQQQVTTIGYARDVGGDGWLVTLYSDVFATSGDVYEIAHAAEHALYSGAQQHEAIRGVIRNGKSGRFTVDIPLFSSREFVCSGRFQHPSLRLEPVSWPAADQGLAGFRARIAGAFPDECIEIRLVHAGRMWSAKLDGDHIAALAESERLRDALGVASLRDRSRRYAAIRGRSNQVRYEPNGAESRVPMAEIGGDLLAPLLVERLGLLWDDRAVAADDHGRIQVFVLAKAPPAFAVRCAGLERDDAVVVFHTDLIQER